MVQLVEPREPPVYTPPRDRNDAALSTTASSGESVGERRRRKVPERMIQRDLEGFC
jgi:hypothetical protein